MIQEEIGSFKEDKTTDYTKIKERRKELGLTQAQLAEKAGLTERALRNIESGQSTPHGSTQAMLADALYPGETERFVRLIAPLPDFSESLARLEKMEYVYRQLEEAIMLIADPKDNESLSHALSWIGSTLYQFWRSGGDFGPYISGFCGALCTSTMMTGYLDELEGMWIGITTALAKLGVEAREAYTKMQETHRTQDFFAKLTAVKTAIKVAERLYKEPDKQEACLIILEDSGVILGGAQLIESDRVALCEKMVAYAEAFNKARQLTIQKALSGG